MGRGVRIIGIDADAEILRVAARRLRRGKATLVHGSFVGTPFPVCNAFTASFALHHVESSRVKRELFRRAHAALKPRGLLVSADCHPPTSPWLAKQGRAGWLSHLARRYGRRKGAEFLRTWQHEDFYTTLETETRLLQSAGFTTDVIWRRGLFAVIVAERGG
jgi:ubiquinone/menaquinone biosynthesis C-methylase UbiE